MYKIPFLGCTKKVFINLTHMMILRSAYPKTLNRRYISDSFNGNMQKFKKNFNQIKLTLEFLAFRKTKCLCSHIVVFLKINYKDVIIIPWKTKQ